MGDDHKTVRKHKVRKTLTERKPKKTDSEAILQKIEKIRETTAFLRLNLERERDELERARLYSTYPVPTSNYGSNMIVPMRSSFYMTYPEYGGGPAAPMSPYFFGAVPDWRQLALQRQQQQMSPWVPYGYSITLPEGPPRCVKSLIPNNYMTELDNVDRLCRKELVNMQTNMRNLRRMSDSWKDVGGGGGSRSTSSSSENGDYQDRRVRRRIRRRVLHKTDDGEDSYY